MMRLTVDGHAYEGPEPTGARGMRLYAAVHSALGKLGFGGHLPFPVLSEEDTPERKREAMGDYLREVSRMQRAIASTSQASSLFASTFEGWSRDGAPLSASSLETLYGIGSFHEPWAALVKAWEAAGFFRVPGQGGPAVDPEISSPTTTSET